MAALLSAGTSNLVLLGSVQHKRDNRERNSVKYPAEYSSSSIVSLDETHVNKMDAKAKERLL